MATPIRWDTVRGPSLAEAAVPLQQAQRSFLSGFGDLGNVLAQREAMDQANYQNTRANNTNAFLDAVAKYRTPEELKAAQDSGALDALRAAYNGQVDAGAIRGAADARTAALQQQAQNRIAYEHMQTDERVAPLLDQFKRATLADDPVAAAAAQKQYEQLGGRDLAGLASFADQRAQQMVERGRATTNFGNQQEKFKKDLQVADANIRQSDAGVRASDANVRAIDFNIQNTKDQTEMARAAGRAAAIKNSLREQGNLYANGVYDGSQSTDLMMNMVKNKIGDTDEDRTMIIKKLNELAKEGVEITGPNGQKTKIHDLPLSAVEAAINSANDSVWYWGWNSGAAKDMVNNLKQVLKTEAQGADGKTYSKVADDLVKYSMAINNARQNAPAIVPQRAPKPNGK
ncbi:MAG TPA: hypothetical protein VM783_09210 [Candidatus Acidoferrum sp.]|nr:hypothetical protein [Candidatus Acidoferrum sp.]